MTSVELEKARLRRTEKGDRRKSVIGIGTALFVLFGFIAFLNLIDSVNLAFRATQNNLERFLYWLVVATLGFIGPYGFYVAKLQREVKQIERRLPDFLRDVAEAGRFGMTLAEAIVVSSGGRYGKLTPEIKKMAAQITWGVPATEALRLFATRVKTPMVGRVVAIIVKSSDAGGDVADVLTMVSHDTKENQLTEDERRITMSTYIAVIYISFMVFLVTIWILNVTFLPKMLEASGALEPERVARSPERAPSPTTCRRSSTTSRSRSSSPLSCTASGMVSLPASSTRGRSRTGSDTASSCSSSACSRS